MLDWLVHLLALANILCLPLLGLIILNERAWWERAISLLMLASSTLMMVAYGLALLGQLQLLPLKVGDILLLFWVGFLGVLVPFAVFKAGRLAAKVDTPAR